MAGSIGCCAIGEAYHNTGLRTTHEVSCPGFVPHVRHGSPYHSGPMDLKAFARAQHTSVEGKAIPPHPALMDPSIVPTYSSHDVKRVRTPFGQREAARHLQA